MIITYRSYLQRDDDGCLTINGDPKSTVTTEDLKLVNRRDDKVWGKGPPSSRLVRDALTRL